MAQKLEKAPTVTNLTVDGDTVDKTTIGLGSVNNTADLDKPISNDTQDALDIALTGLEAGNNGINDARAPSTTVQFTSGDVSVDNAYLNLDGTADSPAAQLQVTKDGGKTVFINLQAGTVASNIDVRADTITRGLYSLVYDIDQINASDWNGAVAPTDLMSAISQLASRLKAIEDA